MARVKGTELISKALKLEGVTNIFALAGDHILPLLDLMVDQSFRFIDTRHEQAAVHMADAWAIHAARRGMNSAILPAMKSASARTAAGW